MSTNCAKMIGRKLPVRPEESCGSEWQISSYRVAENCVSLSLQDMYKDTTEDKTVDSVSYYLFSDLPIVLCSDIQLLLRKANHDDSARVFEIKKAAFRDYVDAVWGWDEDQQRQLHKRRFSEQGYFVIELSGKTVGTGAVKKEADCIKISQLFLLPDYQGKGIGRKFICHIQEDARELKLPIRLRVMKANLRALAFYTRLGFVVVGETDTHINLQWVE